MFKVGGKFHVPTLYIWVETNFQVQSAKMLLKSWLTCSILLQVAVRQACYCRRFLPGPTLFWKYATFVISMILKSTLQQIFFLLSFLQFNPPYDKLYAIAQSLWNETLLCIPSYNRASQISTNNLSHFCDRKLMMCSAQKKK